MLSSSGYDVLVVGGGVIGLSLAYQLSGQRLRVRVIDAAQPGREASWAGAGILPPAGVAATDPLEQLTALSNQLHATWHEQLLAETGIDNGYRRCGGIYLARDERAAAELRHAAEEWRRTGIEFEDITADGRACEPALNLPRAPRASYFLPDECQLRNPRHLKALLAGCAARRVEVSAGVAADDFVIRSGRIDSVRTSAGPLSATHVVLASGAWSRSLALRLGVSPAIRPIRGQIVLLASANRVLTRVLNEGKRYLVPRDDGRVLVGSTEEDVGFDHGTTAIATQELLQFALELVPSLADAQLERTWAGLRPATRDGRPYLGALPGLEGAWIAAGHFRSGLQLSPATAVLLSQQILGTTPLVDLTSFRADRG